MKKWLTVTNFIFTLFPINSRHQNWTTTDWTTTEIFPYLFSLIMSLGILSLTYWYQSLKKKHQVLVFSNLLSKWCDFCSPKIKQIILFSTLNQFSPTCLGEVTLVAMLWLNTSGKKTFPVSLWRGKFICIENNDKIISCPVKHV